MKPELKDLISCLKGLAPIVEDAKQHVDTTSINQLKAWQLVTTPVHIKALLDHIEELEEQQKLWLEPTPEMTQAGLAEVQRMLDEWSDDCVDVPEEVTDDMASDMAVFTLQAMAGAK